jgi:tripartite-type tricarboxylate transporter receptor subunit TctC
MLVSRSSRSLSSFLTIALLGASPVAANADEISDFYAGKTLTIQVGFSAGGGYDTTALLLAKNIGNHIPGKPAVVVQNVPGGGSTKLASSLFNTAPKNGLVIGMGSSSSMVIPLYGKRKVKFVADKFEWIGNAHRDAVACGMWRGAGQGIKSLHDLSKAKKTVVFGSTRPTSNLSKFPTFLKNVLGANVTVVHGYRGSKPITLAMERGEVDGACMFYGSSISGPYNKIYKSGDLNLIAQYGEDGKVPLFGDATPIFPLMKTKEQREMARLLFAPSELTRPFAAPPGTPRPRVAALRKSFMDTFKDSSFKADAQGMKTEFAPMSGEEVEKWFAQLYSTPKDIVDKTYQLTISKKNPKK